VCLGERDGARKAWTTVEEGDGLALVEIDAATRSQSLVALLPWRATDDDLPTVHDLLRLEDARMLIVASDFGVVCLRESQPNDVPAP
jgi:hypothetical protein